MSDETPETPPAKPAKKRPSEIVIMGRIERMLEGYTDAEKRRIAFVFAEQVGLKYQVPTNGETHG